MNDQATITSRELVRELIWGDQIYALADCVPPRDPHEGGRPRRYPMWVVFLFDALLHHFGSASRVESELEGGGLWDLIQREAYAHHGETVSDLHMTRHTFGYWRNALKDPVLAEKLRAAQTKSAIRIANGLGLICSDGPRSPTRPDETRLIVGDGTVLRPRSTHAAGSTRLNKATGELKVRRADPTATIHTTGTGDRVTGNKAVIWAVRGPGTNRQVVLDVKMDKAGHGGEARTALSALDDLLPHAPGVDGVLYDGAFRGTHIEHIQRRYGIGVMVRVHLYRRGDDEQPPELKAGPARTATHTLSGGTTRQVNLHAIAGRPHVARIDVNGDLDLVPLEPGKVERRGRPGNYRFYRRHPAPASIGGGTIRVRYTSDQDDRDAKFNREENLRVHHAGSPAFDEHIGKRSMIESLNANLKSELDQHRAHSYGHDRIQFDMYGFALRRNAIATWAHTRRQTDHAPPQAA